MVFKGKEDFAHRIYGKLVTIPKGKVTTYAALARSIGSGAYRAVGTAMRNNPYMGEVPCHRVIPSDGSLGGYNGGEPEKLRLLLSEGVEFDEKGKVLEKFILRTL